MSGSGVSVSGWPPGDRGRWAPDGCGRSDRDRVWVGFGVLVLRRAPLCERPPRSRGCSTLRATECWSASAPAASPERRSGAQPRVPGRERGHRIDIVLDAPLRLICGQPATLADDGSPPMTLTPAEVPRSWSASGNSGILEPGGSYGMLSEAITRRQGRLVLELLRTTLLCQR